MLNRRRLLAVTAAVPVGVALVGCSLTPAQVVKILQSDLQDAYGIEAAINEAIKSYSGPITVAITNAEDTINNLLDDAEKLLNGFSVNGLAPLTTVSNVLNDLSQGLQDYVNVFGSNAYTVSAQVVLAALSATWNAVSAQTAQKNLGLLYAQTATGTATDAAPHTLPTPSLANARALLSVLPRRPVGGFTHKRQQTATPTTVSPPTYVSPNAQSVKTPN